MTLVKLESLTHAVASTRLLSNTNPWLVFAVLALTSIILCVDWKHRLNLRYLPPGPRGLPILGNIFQIPKFQWFRFTEWKEVYGPLFYLNMAGNHVIVLNSHKVAADLLNRHGHVYSDRPRFIMASEILTGGLLIAFTGFGDLWRRMRRPASEGLNARSSAQYKPLQEKEASLLIGHLIRDPDQWDDHLRRSSASTVLSAVYGWPSMEAKSQDDALVARINDLMHRIVHAALPGAFLVEIFPVMKHLPTWIAKWKREGLEWYAKDTAMFEGFMDTVRNQVKTTGSNPCFAASLIENNERYRLTDKESAWLSGTMFGAGAETTAASLSVFMLAMVLYPDVMKRAQAEIDSVVGRDRMPTFADEPHLPYVRAMVKEILRWRPVGPLGLPRRVYEDDWYEGHFIPKGTVVIYNVWAMNRDPEIYPDFEEFRPDRFLDETGQNDVTPADTLNLGHVTYGFGKRICIGMYLANQALFIDFASMLWAFNIERACDSSGNLITPSRTDIVDEGLVVRPVPFKCSITPRSSNVVAVVEATRAALV